MQEPGLKMSKKHKKHSKKKDNTLDSKDFKEPEIGTPTTKDQSVSQSLDDSIGVTTTKWSLDLKDTTKSFQKDTLKSTKYTCRMLKPADQREKITMHFKNMANRCGERRNLNSAATFPSKEDSDVCGKPDVKRRKRSLQDLRIRNSSEKKEKTANVECTKLKESSVLEDFKERILSTKCSSLRTNYSQTYEFSRKQNTFKKPYPSFSVSDNSVGPNLHTQACQEDDLKKAECTSSKLPHKSDREMPCAPSGHLPELFELWKCPKQKEQQRPDSTKHFGNSQTQRKKFAPVKFHNPEVLCHISACEAIGYTDGDQEMQIVEDLHAARNDKKMVLPVVQTCGELTSMEIDFPDDDANISAKTLSDLNTLIVIDTNIMISHLEFIKSLKDTDIPGIGSFVLVVPWVVLQELDNLKRGKILQHVGKKAIPAVHFIYTCLKNQDSKLWGQSMQLASQKTYDFTVENNDDRVLQCCLQYQSLFPQAEVVLLTDDKNLSNKALVSEVKAFGKADFVTALKNATVNSTVLSQDAPCVQQQSQKGTRSKKAKENPADSSIMFDLEKSLGEVLSSILQTEMIIAYGDLWTEVVYHKPPWTLTKLLECYKKHWIAVFGQVVSRSLLSTIDYLYTNLCTATVFNHSTIQMVLQESKMLLEMFSSRSNYEGVLSQALAQVNKLLESLEKIQSDTGQNSSDALKSTSVSPACEKMEDGTLPQHTPAGENSFSLEPLNQGNRHLEIWSVLENVGNSINLFSHEIFEKLDINARTNTQDISSFKEAFLGLEKLMAAVNEILVAIRQVLTPNSSFQDVWALYSFLTNNEINNSINFTAEEFYNCISQELYRKRLSIGCSQLTQLEHTIKQCYESVCLEAKNRGWL
ncbi:transcriptional protein SWT1 isoform X2 [Tiliqua scincoides]|uniref:transcriptional protein SWT1 isoform X2 n=1 Tax=Tiliqua scincoides TaxID=71010 RepID=UPI00346343B1